MFRTLTGYRLLVPALLLATLATSTVLYGQHAPAVLTGERVRLWAPDAIEGTVIRATADTIVLETSTPDGAVAVVGASIQRFERRVPVGRHTLTGAGLGLATGVGAAAIASTDCDGAVFSASDCFILAGLLLAPAGTLLGALIGHAYPRYGWREFRLPARTGIIVEPRGVGLAILTTF